MKVSVILPAAGLGTRMGRAVPEKAGTSRKQFMLLDGSPILLHTIRQFVAAPEVVEIVVALRTEEMDWVRELLAAERFSTLVRLSRRQIASRHSAKAWAKPATSRTEALRSSTAGRKVNMIGWPA